MWYPGIFIRGSGTDWLEPAVSDAFIPDLMTARLSIFFGNRDRNQNVKRRHKVQQRDTIPVIQRVHVNTLTLVVQTRSRTSLVNF